MDLIFSCTPLSTSLSSAASTKLTRSDFLGGCHFLRPPGAPPPCHSPLRRRGSKCKRQLRLRKDRHRTLLVNASFDSNSVVVFVAVTTLSALSFAYLKQRFNNDNNGNKNSSNEVSSSPTVLLSQFGKSIASHVNGHLDVGGLNRVTTEPKTDDLVNKVRGETHGIEAEEKNGQTREIGSVHHSTVSVATREAVNDQHSSDASVSVASRELEGGTVSIAIPSVFGDEATLEQQASAPVSLTAKLSESNVGERTEEVNVDVELPEVKVKINTDVASGPLNLKSKEKNEETAFLYPITDESVRGDLYTFYGANHPLVKHPSTANSFKATALSSSHHNNNNRSSSMKPNAISVEEGLTIQNSTQQPAENVGRRLSLGSHGRDASRKHKALGKNRAFPKEKERAYLVQDDRMELPKLPSLDGDRGNDNDHLRKQMNTYNKLLRDGRLVECVDLLEDLESRNLLDMNKVHHAKFFNNCKSTRAVNDAFRFCKLIPNPALSTFNMLMSVCASSQDAEGAFQVLRFAQEAGFKADCKLYTTLISTCGKSGKVDKMFEVFHEMVNAGIEPNVHTYGALIDGCARAGQVAKAFGAYGIMRSKNVKPDRVVFNALITACGQSGAVDRAFDVLAEMKAEVHPIDPDHITVGALIKACAQSGQVHRALEAYKLVHEYNIKGTPELYTIAVNCCSQTGDWDFACDVYDDMTKKGVVPDEVFLSAMIDAAGHSGKIDAAFAMLKEAKQQGMQLGIITYSSLMGACCNAKNWEKALELYEDIKSSKQKPTVSTMNALITALCDGDQQEKAVQVLKEMRSFGLCPNTITYSVLFVASERNDDINVALDLLSQAKEDGLGPTLIMCKCITAMCLRRYKRACKVGEPVLSFDSGRPQIENKWTSLALTVYRETIAAGEIPTAEAISLVLGCLQFPCDAPLKDKLIEFLGVTAELPRRSKLCSLLDGFGEYDRRAFSLVEEAASRGIVPCVSFKESPIVVDAKSLLHVYIAEVYLLTVLKGLKHRLAAGAKLPNITILLPIEKTEVTTSDGEKAINLSGRINRAVGALFRRLKLPYQGNESYGKIRINGIALRRWFQPKLDSPFGGKPGEWSLSQSQIGKGIFYQQRNIRTGNLSLE